MVVHHRMEVVLAGVLRVLMDALILMGTELRKGPGTKRDKEVER